MKTLLLVSTFSRMKRYSAAIEAAVDRCWPGHPPMYFISDCELSGIERQIWLADACWTEILLHGLLTVRQQHPALDYVFLMLDDHCPLRACDAATISTYLEIARGGNLAVISFPTYEWPWRRTERVDYPDGLVRTWRCIDIEVVDGRRLAVVPGDFFRYFQVQPAFWNIEYLTSACRTALARGITDPWAFEAMRLDGARQHYVADYDWPNVHHGFIAAGRINPVAISYVSRAPAVELYQQLLRELDRRKQPLALRAVSADEQGLELVSRHRQIACGPASIQRPRLTHDVAAYHRTERSHPLLRCGCNAPSRDRERTRPAGFRH